MPDIIQLLIAERDKLDRAIAALGAVTKRRGRPPKANGAAPSKRRGRGRSAASRKRQSQRMKAYWAARRKKKKG